ncbi:MAG: HAMP domain-containing sensor histidine kinase [Flavobacteriales bacterium]|nr:HAMP domain-containing sensor histidine kinase [Flavobacteriales bacterium]
MRILRSLAFKIWLIFTIVGLSLSVPMAVHYNNVHFDLLKNHSKKALYSNALITKQAIIIAIENTDLQGLRNQLDQIKKSSEFSYIALIEGHGTEQHIFACYPDSLKHLVFAENENYITIKEPLDSKLIQGSIIMASSLDEDLKTLAQINRPVIYLSTIAILSSIVLFGFSLFFISRPISSAVVFAKNLEAKKYNHGFKRKQGKDEISTLNNALISLSSNLENLEKQNELLLHNLEDEVEIKTAQLRTQNKLNKALFEMSKSFINANTDNYREIVAEGLQSLIGFFQLDLVMFCDLNESSVVVSHSNRFVLINKEISPLYKTLSESENLQPVPIPEGFVKSIDSDQNLFMISGMIGVQENRRVLIFSCDHHEKHKLLEIGQSFLAISTIISNLEQRVNQEAELRLLNSNLESKVIENTKVNLDLSNNIVAQDKLATIGEVAAGVAHDLNSPLGAIKASNTNLYSLLNHLFKNPNEIDWKNSQLALQIYDTGQREIFTSGIKLIQSAREMEEMLRTKMQDEALLSDIASAFTRSGIDKHEIELINQILELDEPLHFLKSLRQIQLIGMFQKSIEESVARASEVVSSLTLFVREDLTQEKSNIVLKSSIESVEKVFKYRTRNQIKFINNISKEVVIFGIEVKLLQLWSNIIKNAIDALDESDQADKYIAVSSSTEDDALSVCIENNGPMIDEEDQKKILKKFFTTKEKNKGTGLGMSIVKNVVDEHRGTLSFTSTQEKTIFSIRFPLQEVH